MPRLLMFAPCEKIIIAQGDNSVSLIGILQNFQINPNQDGTVEVPANATLPISWTIFALWQKEAGDEGVGFAQRIALISRSGKTLLESVTAFVMEKDWHRIATGIVGLPIGESGTHTLKLWLRRGEAGAWQEVSTFPLTITHPASVRSSSLLH